MLAPQPGQRTELKTGQRPVQMDIRSFKPGDELFHEGSTGRELFSIQEGIVGIYKESPEGQVELARVEKGGIIGEMSLLDNMPRSATVKALEPTKAMVINEAFFHAAVAQVPVWLSSIIKIVVSRLRDANKRVDQSVLRDKERGLVSLVLLLLPSCKYEFAGGLALDYDATLLEAYYVCRLKKKEILKYLGVLEKRELIKIEEDTNHRRHIAIRDLEALKLFEEFCILKSQQKKFREITIPEDVVATLSNIAYVAQKSGVETDEGTTLNQSALVADLAGKKDDKLERNLLNLRRRNLINTMPQDGDTLIVFKKETLNRIKKIKEWLPRFEKVIE